MAIALLLAGSLFGALPSWALDQSKLPQGANHERAHSGSHRSVGKDVPIGVIETPSTAINASHNLGTRLKAEWSFSGKDLNNPDPTDNSAAGDNHTTLVADVAAGGANGNRIGVAPGAHVYVAEISGPGSPANVAERDGDDAIHDTSYESFRAAVNWMYTPRNEATDTFKNHERIALFNNSWGAVVEQDDNGQNRFAQFADYFSRTRDALFVGAAGNQATTAGARINWPWDAYNGITVGASDASFQARADFSQYWLDTDNGTQPDKRGKPDILAPGQNIGDGVAYAGGEQSGTSFATPHVTGVAALLAAGTEQIPAGLPLGSQGGVNHLAQKAIILNSARKRGINPPENDHRVARDNAATANEPSDSDYLAALGIRPNKVPVGTLRNGATPGNPKTAEWTPTQWSSDGRTLTVTKPLDDEQGTGLLDAERALIQYDGGEQEDKIENPGGIGPIGWNREILSASLPADIYEFNFAIQKGTFITASLVWDRIIAEAEGDGMPGDGIVELSDTYSLSTADLGPIPDFDLYIFFMDELVARSISITENVEHLHYPVPEYGNPFDYEIRVDLHGFGDTFYDYALAWWTAPVPAPPAILLLAMGLAMLCVSARWRRERPGLAC